MSEKPPGLEPFFGGGVVELGASPAVAGESVDVTGYRLPAILKARGKTSVQISGVQVGGGVLIDGVVGLPADLYEAFMIEE